MVTAGYTRPKMPFKILNAWVKERDAESIQWGGETNQQSIGSTWSRPSRHYRLAKIRGSKGTRGELWEGIIVDLSLTRATRYQCDPTSKDQFDFYYEIANGTFNHKFRYNSLHGRSLSLKTINYRKFFLKPNAAVVCGKDVYIRPNQKMTKCPVSCVHKVDTKKRRVARYLREHDEHVLWA